MCQGLKLASPISRQETGFPSESPALLQSDALAALPNGDKFTVVCSIIGLVWTKLPFIRATAKPQPSHSRATAELRALLWQGSHGLAALRCAAQYAQGQLLFLHKSLLDPTPYGMPAFRDWLGTENDQLSSTTDSEALPVGNPQDRRLLRDMDDGSARQSYRSVTIAQSSQMESPEHQSIRVADHHRDGDAEREQDRERLKAGQERLPDLSDKYDRDHRALPSAPLVRAEDDALTPMPRLAFLGPLGTYSHQATFECFGDSVKYLARPTIADVQRTLSAAVPFGVIPQENSTNGSVVETYDVLRTPVVGQEIFVRGVTVFEVKHSLVVRRGVRMENIESVLSHEQALGQCRGWLAKHLPRASLVPTDSTATAAKKLLSAESGLDPMRCAAICSSAVVVTYEGLEILEKSIQDGRENFTRFYILSHGLDIPLPEGCPRSTESAALLRLQAPGDPVKPILNISRAISMFDISILRIDRRPLVHGRPFDSVYFVEVGTIPGQNSPKELWAKQVEQAVDKIKCMDIEVSILGCW